MATATDRKAAREMAKRHEIEALEKDVREWQEEIDAMVRRNNDGERYTLQYNKRMLRKAQVALAEAK